MWYFIDLPLYFVLFGVPLVWAWIGRRKRIADGRQSWSATLIEVGVGKLFGTAVSFLLNLYALPFIVSAPIEPRDAAIVSAVYAAVATVRSVCTRRIFETLRVKGLLK